MKLHLGCGRRYIDGFVHVDIQPGPHIDCIAQADELPFDSESVELVYASHILEHFGRGDIQRVLREWRRVLKPDGVLRISVPDFAACAKVYSAQGLEDGLSGLIGLICGGQRDAYDFHRMVFDEPLLTQHLKLAGFGFVRAWDWRNTEHSHVDDYSQAYLPHMDKVHGVHMSLNLEAIR